MIVFSGSQFTCGIIWLKERPKWKLNEARFFCVARLQVYLTNLVLVECKPLILHHRQGKQNYHRALFIVQTSERICYFFCPILLIIAQFLQNNVTRQITLIQWSFCCYPIIQGSRKSVLSTHFRKKQV